MDITVTILLAAGAVLTPLGALKRKGSIFIIGVACAALGFVLMTGR